jgi:hypothetical protein
MQVLPVELLGGFACALAWATGTAFASKFAPPGLLATAQALFQGLYLGEHPWSPPGTMQLPGWAASPSGRSLVFARDLGTAEWRPLAHQAQLPNHAVPQKEMLLESSETAWTMADVASLPNGSGALQVWGMAWAAWLGELSTSTRAPSRSTGWLLRSCWLAGSWVGLRRLP